MATETRRLVVGISGASGVIYGVRLLELLRETDVETHLVMSKSAEVTLAYETDYKPKDVKALASVNHPATDIGAAISLGARSVLMLTGVTSVAELHAAPQTARPTRVAEDAAGLERALDEVCQEIEGGGRRA
jgi:4-hydroxy-3-polyprenylbenzoate decarboxylase